MMSLRVCDPVAVYANDDFGPGLALVGLVVVIHAQPQAHVGVDPHVLTHAREVVDHLDTRVMQMGLRSYPRQHQQLRGRYC